MAASFAVPRVARGLVPDRSGVQRDRRNDQPLSHVDSHHHHSAVHVHRRGAALVQRRLDDVPRRHSRRRSGVAQRTPASSFDRRPLGCGSRPCCASPSTSPPTGGVVSVDARPCTSGTCSRTPRCCSGVRSVATSSCWPSCRACPRLATPRRPGHRAGRAHRLRRSIQPVRSRCASLARSLVLEPRTFLFDEPFGALDEITVGDSTTSCSGCSCVRVAALFITHSITEAIFLSSRVLVMSARPGRLIAEYDVPFSTRAIPTCGSTPSSPRRRVRSATRANCA